MGFRDNYYLFWTSKNDINKNFDPIVEAINNNEYETAITLSQESLNYFSSDTIKSCLHCFVAIAYFAQKDYDNSLANAETSLDLCSTNNETAYKIRAVIFESQERYQEAIDTYTTILNFKPDDFGSLYSRGKLYSKMDRSQEAIDDFTAAIAIKQTALIYYTRYLEYKKIGKNELAVSDINEALELDKENSTYKKSQKQERKRELFSSCLRSFWPEGTDNKEDDVEKIQEEEKTTDQPRSLCCVPLRRNRQSAEVIDADKTLGQDVKVREVELLQFSMPPYNKESESRDLDNNKGIQPFYHSLRNGLQQIQTVMNGASSDMSRSSFNRNRFEGRVRDVLKLGRRALSSFPVANLIVNIVAATAEHRLDENLSRDAQNVSRFLGHENLIFVLSRRVAIINSERGNNGEMTINLGGFNSEENKVKKFLEDFISKALSGKFNHVLDGIGSGNVETVADRILCVMFPDMLVPKSQKEEEEAMMGIGDKYEGDDTLASEVLNFVDRLSKRKDVQRFKLSIVDWESTIDVSFDKTTQATMAR